MLVYFGLNNIIYAKEIDYFSLSKAKQYFIDNYNNIRYNIFESNVLEAVNILGLSNEKKEGENFLDILENDLNYWNTEYIFYTKANKDEIDINNTIALYKKNFLNENIIEYGPKIKYSFYYNKILNNNKLDLSFVLKSKINQYFININFIQNFNYNFLYFKNYILKKELYNINGILNVELNVGDKVKFLPNIVFSYIYDFKNNFIDQNLDKIKINSGFDFLVGVGSKLEYLYSNDLKIKFGISYVFSKLFYKKNKYEIFKMNLINNDYYDYMHLFSIYVNAIIKEKHRIKVIFAYNKKYIFSLSYNINL